jgi:hypothetical protein
MDQQSLASRPNVTSWNPDTTRSGSQVDPSWYSEPLVEDSFGELTVEDRLTQPALDEVRSTLPIIHAAISPIETPTYWDRVWLGIGCTSDNGLPFDALEMMIVQGILCRRLGCESSLLIADAHAVYVGENVDQVNARAKCLADCLKEVLTNLGLTSTVFLASSLDNDPGYRRYLGLAEAWRANLEPGLPPYLVRGMADSAYMASKRCLKLGWSTSPEPTLGSGRFHEPATDLRALQIQRQFGGAYTRPGFTLRGDRPISIPYAETREPEDRLMLTGLHFQFNCRLNYVDQIARSNQSARGLKRLEYRLSLITDAYERHFRKLNGESVFLKAEALARIAIGS